VVVVLVAADMVVVAAIVEFGWNPASGAKGTPSGPSAAITPLELPIVQELFTLKRRKRRAPAQGVQCANHFGEFSPRAESRFGTLQ
jgi:hypothetical protein